MKSDKTTLLIQLDLDLKKSFQAVCDSQDQNASQVLRQFMRDYVKKHGQGDLFKKYLTAG